MFNKYKTVDQIVSSFTKTITELERVVTENSGVITNNAHLIQQLVDSSAAAQKEADSATAIANKLKAIFA